MIRSVAAVLPPFLSGLQLCRIFYVEAVRPLLDQAEGCNHRILAARRRDFGVGERLWVLDSVLAG